MDTLIQVVGEELQEWEEEQPDANRYSIFTQNVMLAEKVSKHQHLLSKSLELTHDDRELFHPVDANVILPKVQCLSSSRAPSAPRSATEQRPSSTNNGRTRIDSCEGQQPSQRPSGDWSWKPVIPRRTSSMSTRRKKGNVPSRPDPAAFYRRSCQLFSSLDSTLSQATTVSEASRVSTNTPPSLASSVTTQATAISVDDWSKGLDRTSFHLKLQDPALLERSEPRSSLQSGDFSFVDNHSSRLGPRRSSSSRLSPRVTSTAQVFWTSEESRQADYAKIDAAHTGVKGLFKRMLPRSWRWAHGKRRNLYPQQCSGIRDCSGAHLDDDSVRRLRVSTARNTSETVRFAEADDVFRPQSAISSAELGTGRLVRKPVKPTLIRKIFAKAPTSKQGQGYSSPVANVNKSDHDGR